MKNPKPFARIIIETTQNDADVIFSKLIEIDDINRTKYDMFKNLTTTELIDNIDLLTLYEIATELNLDPQLPNQEIKGSHLFVEYKWGTVVLMANMTEN